MNDLLTFDQIRPDDTLLVGGKGLSLALLTAAGLPVPPGFCLTTTAHRRLHRQGLAADSFLLAALAEACTRLGDGPVAVRSSATGEDGAVSSFAGQQETILGVHGPEAIREAIERCWASLDSDRARAYRRQQRVSDDEMAMAVVVQRLVPAEVAGVLFTRDPLDPTGEAMLVEASWGLGEMVVSGRVSPDRFHLARQSCKVLDRHIATKTLMRTEVGDKAVSPEMQSIPCLDDEQLARLAELGRFVEEFHGEPRDIEWAFAEDRFWLLQSRPITATGPGELEQVRREEIATLKARAVRNGTVWSRFNLSEVLPAPTPLTWAWTNRHLMSGQGGFGLMYRDLGFDPDPALDTEGVFDLVCGRPYCNLSREPRLHYRQVPLGHPFAALVADPRRALYPTPTIDPGSVPWYGWLLLPLRLPGLGWRMLQGAVSRNRLMRTFANRFRAEIAPAFRAEAALAAKQDLSTLDNRSLLELAEHWVRRTMVEFARESLKPTALAALAMASLEQKLATVVGLPRARELVRDLVMGVRPDVEADLAGAVRALAEGTLPREAFLEQFGHRGPEEMELSRPRWTEDSATLGAQVRATVGQGILPTSEQRLEAEPRLNAEQRALVVQEAATVQTLVGLRETGKHYLMYGYSIIRRALVELDRRYGLEGGVFYLTPEELPRLLQGENLSETITARKRRRALVLGLEVPAVLFSTDLDAIGRPAPADSAEEWTGVPLSAGVAEGPALVLDRPEAASGEGMILVCPTTDPAWVPLFVGAKGLVMETGGVLSHGAIVAREFGLPAVAGLPGVLKQVRTGQRLRVDGVRGTVTLLREGETAPRA